jgi:hypothetical protein
MWGTSTVSSFCGVLGVFVKMLIVLLALNHCTVLSLNLCTFSINLGHSFLVMEIYAYMG